MKRFRVARCALALVALVAAQLWAAPPASAIAANDTVYTTLCTINMAANGTGSCLVATWATTYPTPKPSAVINVGVGCGKVIPDKQGAYDVIGGLIYMDVWVENFGTVSCNTSWRASFVNGT